MSPYDARVARIWKAVSLYRDMETGYSSRGQQTLFGQNEQSREKKNAKKPATWTMQRDAPPIVVQAKDNPLRGETARALFDLYKTHETVGS